MEVNYLALSQDEKPYQTDLLSFYLILNKMASFELNMTNLFKKNDLFLLEFHFGYFFV